MRWALAAAALVACGGQIVDEPLDAAVDSSIPKDASQDVPATFVDVTGIDDTPIPAQCLVSKSSLLAYYPLDGDTNDHSGHGFDAVATTELYTGGLLNSALHFDGSTQSLRVTGGAGMLQGPRTLCAWTKSNPTTGAGQPVFWGGSTNQGDFYSLFSSAPGNTSCTNPLPNTPFVDHGSNCFVAPTQPIVLGQWQLVCYAFDGGAVEISVNGVENKTPGTLYDYPLTTLFIGSNPTPSSTTGTTFTGIIDEVSVWSVALSFSDLQALWNNGKGCPL